MRRRALLLNLFSLLAGVLLFVCVIEQTGRRELLARLQYLGPSFLLIILVSGARPLVRALAWLRCMQPEDRGVGFFTVWRARLIGDAIGNLTMVGPVAAEPARLIFFGGKLPLTSAASSLSVEFFTYFVSCCLVMLSGLATLLGIFVISQSIREASIVALLGLLLIVAVAVIILSWRVSLIAVLHATLNHFFSEHHFSPRIDRQIHKLLTIENYLFDFYRRRPRDFASVACYEALFHISAIIEIYLTLRLIGERTTWTISFIFEATTRLINMVFAFVPLRVGVDEAGTGLLAETLGVGTLTGVTLAIYRKIRVLFWTAVGLACLAAFTTTVSKDEKPERESETKEKF